MATITTFERALGYATEAGHTLYTVQADSTITIIGAASSTVEPSGIPWSEVRGFTFRVTGYDTEEVDGIVNTKLTPEQIQENINAEARQYLQSTDWYVVRFYETGVAIPEDIKEERQRQRELVVDYFE